MNKQVITLDVDHEGIIDDCQFDYYGLRVASCDSKGFVQIVNIENEQINTQSKVNFQAHKGPCWQVQWAHPKFESVIATCGYDKKIHIWKEVSSTANQSPQWDRVYSVECQTSANCLAFAPWEYGLHIAAGTQDGKIYIISRRPDDTWNFQSYQAHDGSINGVAWGPPTEPQLLAGEHVSAQNQQLNPDGSYFSIPHKRIVSGSSDKKVKLWVCRDNKFELLKELGEHEDWVRDVAWCNNIGLMSDTIASCGEDQKVKIWKNESTEKNINTWVSKDISFAYPLWKVSFSQVGNMLAISGGDNQVQIYKETAGGEWENISKVNEEGVLEEI